MTILSEMYALMEQDSIHSATPRIDRILWNRRPENLRDGGDIDEIVVHDCTVHIEQMDVRCWWIGISKGDAWWSGQFYCDKNGPMTFSEQDYDLPWDSDEVHV